MARIRYIKPEFFDSEQVAGVSLAARLLFAGLWTVADREGRFDLAPRRLKARLFPYDDLNVEPLLSELIAAKLVTAYRVDGVLYGWMPGFVKHQRPHPNEAKSTLPACPPDGALPEVSWNITSRNDGLRQSRGEGNGDGEGTEGEGTAHAPVALTVETTARSMPRHRGYSDHLNQRLDPSAAAHALVSDKQQIAIPGTWWERARKDRGLAFDDVDTFAKWLAAEVRGGLAIGKHKLSWLDEQLARWCTARRAVSAADAEFLRTEAWRAEQAAHEATRATPQEILEGLRAGRASR